MNTPTSRTSTVRIADEYVATLADHEPAAAQALGVTAQDRLPDLSAEWAVERRALAVRTRDALATVEPTTADAALHAALRERMDSDIALFDTGFTARLLAPLATPVHLVREAFDDVTVTDDAAGDEIITRLSGVPRALTELDDRLKWARAAGERGEFIGTGIAAERQVREVADQIASWIDPDGVDYFPLPPRDRPVHLPPQRSGSCGTRGDRRDGGVRADAARRTAAPCATAGCRR